MKIDFSQLSEDSDPTEASSPADYWFVVAVDLQGNSLVIDCHPDAVNYQMIDGTSCEDNGIETPDDPGLYRLTNLKYSTSTDWETGIVDEWCWNLGDVETLWQPGEEISDEPPSPGEDHPQGSRLVKRLWAVCVRTLHAWRRR